MSRSTDSLRHSQSPTGGRAALASFWRSPHRTDTQPLWEHAPREEMSPHCYGMVRMNSIVLFFGTFKQKPLLKNGFYRYWRAVCESDLTNRLFKVNIVTNNFLISLINQWCFKHSRILKTHYSFTEEVVWVWLFVQTTKIKKCEFMWASVLFLCVVILLAVIF